MLALTIAYLVCQSPQVLIRPAREIDIQRGAVHYAVDYCDEHGQRMAAPDTALLGTKPAAAEDTFEMLKDHYRELGFFWYKDDVSDDGHVSTIMHK